MITLKDLANLLAVLIHLIGRSSHPYIPSLQTRYGTIGNGPTRATNKYINATLNLGLIIKHFVVVGVSSFARGSYSIVRIDDSKQRR